MSIASVEGMYSVNMMPTLSLTNQDYLQVDVPSQADNIGL